MQPFSFHFVWKAIVLKAWFTLLYMPFWETGDFKGSQFFQVEKPMYFAAHGALKRWLEQHYVDY